MTDILYEHLHTFMGSV